MIVSPVKTDLLKPGELSLEEVLTTYVTELNENQILVVTSKLISLCENRVVAAQGTDKEALIEQEADLFLPSEFSKYNYHFTIKRNTLAAAAGIDESNGGDVYILWPKDPQASANHIRKLQSDKFRVGNLGVIVTDSISQPMRLGTTGVAIGYSGFKPINDYRGKPDLFNKAMSITRSNIAGGLAASAVVAMGEGSEQTPLCVISEVPFVQFTSNDPSPTELEEYFSSLEDDLFAPMINSLPWQKSTKKEP